MTMRHGVWQHIHSASACDPDGHGDHRSGRRSLHNHEALPQVPKPDLEAREEVPVLQKGH